MYEYFLARAKSDITGEKITGLEHSVQNDEYRLQEQNVKIDGLIKEKEEKQEIRDNLNAELSQDKDFLARDAQKRKLKHLEEQKTGLAEERKRLMESITKAEKQVKKLLEVKDVDDCVHKYQGLLKQADHIIELADFKQTLQEVINYKTQMYGKVQMKKAEVSIQRNTADKEKRELEKRIELLNKKKLSYPEEVNRVMEAIKAEFIRIGRTPNYVYLKGEVSFAVKDTEFQIGGLKQGIGISGDDLSEIRFCDMSAVKRVLTIENLTTFFRWEEQESLIIYLGGYHNSIRRTLLKAIYDVLPDAKYYHFGDIDAGGFEIYRDLCEKTKIPFQMYRMDLDTLMSYQQYGKELTENDRIRLKKILERSMDRTDGLGEIIRYMLENNVKLEQECILEVPVISNRHESLL